jgi:hypothetical protein
LVSLTIMYMLTIFLSSQEAFFVNVLKETPLGYIS